MQISSVPINVKLERGGGGGGLGGGGSGNPQEFDRVGILII